MQYENESRGYDDEARDYRERSRSPRPDRRENGDSRARSASPNDRAMNSRGPPSQPRGGQDDDEDEEGATNTGTNLFVTGIHPRLSEQDVTRLFEKYGEVEKCNIMRDPHTRDSRGFGFVKMVTSAHADAAKEGLQGEVYEGRTLSIEKARRNRPRTPTPGKYFGPPKREDFRAPPTRGGRYERDDRRGGYGRRDDSYRGSRYGGDRYDDRRRDRDDYGSRNIDRYASSNIDRYASSRDDRYGSRGDDRRGGSYRDDARAAPYADPAAPKDTYSGSSRNYDDRGDDRYSRR